MLFRKPKPASPVIVAVVLACVTVVAGMSAVATADPASKFVIVPLELPTVPAPTTCGWPTSGDDDGGDIPQEHQRTID